MKKFAKVAYFSMLSWVGVSVAHHYFLPLNSLALDAPKSALSSLDTDKSNTLKLLTLGDDAAKIEIIEYSSLGCPHCASFHLNRLPAIKQKYIDTKVAKLIMHDVVDDQISMQGAVLLQCIDENDKAIELKKKIFGIQAELSNMRNSKKKMSKGELYKNRLQKITELAEKVGVDKDVAQQCIKAKSSLRAIFDDMHKAFNQYNLKGTPTFIIRISGKPEVSKIVNGTLTTDDIEEFLKVHAKEINLDNQTNP